MIKKIVFVISCFCFAIAVNAQQIPKLKMADVVKNFEQKNDSIYVINFWATFCKPCVAEIPNFIKISNKYKKDKVKLMLVSLDLPSFYPKRIAAFATKNNFATNIAWLEETNADYFCPMIDKSWGGSIPATIIVNTKTGYRKFFEAELSAVEFEKELKNAIADKISLRASKFLIPMKEAKIIAHNPKLPNTSLSSYGLTFTSKDSTVYAVDNGVVGNTLILDGVEVVIIEKEGLSYFYTNLKNTAVRIGEVINQNQVIGYAEETADKSEYKVNLNLFKNSKQIPLSKNDFLSGANKDNGSYTYE